MLNFLKPKTPTAIELDIMEDAQRQLINHQAAAEHHAALAAMYQARILRITAQQAVAA